MRRLDLAILGPLGPLRWGCSPRRWKGCMIARFLAPQPFSSGERPMSLKPLTEPVIRRLTWYKRARCAICRIIRSASPSPISSASPS